MGNKLCVGNLAYSIRDNDLQQAFSQFGAVSSAKVMIERGTGRSKVSGPLIFRFVPGGPFWRARTGGGQTSGPAVDAPALQPAPSATV